MRCEMLVGINFMAIAFPDNCTSAFALLFEVWPKHTITLKCSLPVVDIVKVLVMSLSND